MSYDFTYTQVDNFLNGNGALLHCTYEAIKVLQNYKTIDTNTIDLGNGFKLRYPDASTIEHEETGLWQIFGYDNGVLSCVTDEYFVKLPNGLYTALDEDFMQDFFRGERSLSEWLKHSAAHSAKHKQELQNV